jgi:uncharacterized protein (PEP-CTERM system associated)
MLRSCVISWPADVGAMRPRVAAWAAVGLLVGLAAVPVRAQNSASAWKLQPTLGLEQGVYESRSRIVSADNGLEAVTQVSPGLRLSGGAPGLRLALDYSGTLLARRGGGSAGDGSDFQNRLNANLSSRDASGVFSLAAVASVSQQDIDAFGEQTVQGSVRPSANRSEVSTVSVTPSLSFHLGPHVEMVSRLVVGATESQAASGVDSKSGALNVQWASPKGHGPLGWSLDLNERLQRFDGEGARESSGSSWRAALLWAPLPDVTTSLSGGQEKTSIESSNGTALPSSTSGATAGLRVTWRPSVRTSVDADLNQRPMGRTGRLAFQHRTARTMWSYSASRDTNDGADGLALGQSSLYDLLFEQRASQFPDEAERRAAVLAELASRGLSPNLLVAVPLQTSSYSIVRRQDASALWTGPRSSLGLQLFSSETRQVMSLGDDEPVFGEGIKQKGYSMTVSHRLTPELTAVASGSRKMNKGRSNELRNDLKSVNFSLSSRFGRHGTLVFGGRYTVFNSAVQPYRETAATGALNLRF